jgi:hypothetical protein
VTLCSVLLLVLQPAQFSFPLKIYTCAQFYHSISTSSFFTVCFPPFMTRGPHGLTWDPPYPFSPAPKWNSAPNRAPLNWIHVERLHPQFWQRRWLWSRLRHRSPPVLPPISSRHHVLAHLLPCRSSLVVPRERPVTSVPRGNDATGDGRQGRRWARTRWRSDTGSKAGGGR